MKNVHVNDNLKDIKIINNHQKINKDISKDEFQIVQEKLKVDNLREKKEIRSDNKGVGRQDRSI